jgi:hypothetical protein
MARQRRGDSEKDTGVLVGTLRFFWLRLGNVVLVILALFIYINGSHLDVTLDGLYAGTVALLLTARLADGAISAGRDRISNRRDVVSAIYYYFKKYATRLIIGAGVLWALAHHLGGLLG